MAIDLRLIFVALFTCMVFDVGRRIIGFFASIWLIKDSDISFNRNSIVRLKLFALGSVNMNQLVRSESVWIHVLFFASVGMSIHS